MNLHFLKPRLGNILLTVVILCLPLLREQYNNGQYVAWHRPIELMIQYLQNPYNQSYFQLFMAMSLFALIVYVLASAAIIGITALARKGRTKGLKIG